MLILEKVLILRATKLFGDIPEPDLVDTAYLLEEVHAEEGAIVFEKGEIGKSLYIIHKGSICIHDNNHTLAVLKENDFFGELSLLDTERRSATARAQTDCILFRLEQDAFYELIASNQNILKAILRTLAQRIRSMNTMNTDLYRIIEAGRNLTLT